MKRIACLIAAAVTGCAMTPKDLFDEGMRTERTSTKPPALAAICLIRNIEAHPLQSYTAQQRMLDDRGGIELVLSMIERYTQAILHYKPTPEGSKITVWTCPGGAGRPCRPTNDPDGIEWWFKGC